ncbi:MAG: leucyl aminopeptidase [Actinobacteria bacterium]|nr:leucyl aminopeptidase [Actinomycetota bacterium]
MAQFSYSTESPAKVKADVVVLPVFKGPDPGPGVKDTGLDRAYAAAKLTGKTGENLLVPKRSGDRFAAGAVLLVGAGERKEFTVTALRKALGRVAPSLARFGSVATAFPLVFPGDAEAAQAAVEGLALGAYRFDRYKTKKDDAPKGFSKAVIVGDVVAKTGRDAVARGEVIAEAVAWARDLVNTPAGDMPPAQIAREAQKMAKAVGLTCKVWSEAELKKGGFGGILGVGAGSVNPPRMIELSYKGAGNRAPIALTGKGIAFDSGGLSIKDAKSMETMKDDMGGAASILATMKSIALLRPKVNVIAAIPCSENMPGGSATKPGDILRHRGGKTSEVLNTDAEGRLILADSLAYLTEKKPKAIIDAATLTGACMVALGADITGAMGNDDELIAGVRAAGQAVGEQIWQLPLWKDYKQHIESSVADVKNIGNRYGGAITAALFLEEFVGDTPWVHLDIAGPAFAEQPNDLGPRGGTGVPVRTLVSFLMDGSTK